MYFDLVHCQPAKFTVWTNSSATLPATAESINLPLLAVAGWPRWRTLLINLYQLLRTQKFDEIIVGQILPIGIPVWLLSFVFNFRYTVFIHGLDLASPLQNYKQRVMVKLILRGAAKIAAANHNVAKIATALAGSAENIVIVYPSPVITSKKFGFDRSLSRVQLGLGEELILLMVARLVERKGHALVIEAMAEICKDGGGQKAKLIIIGDGPAREKIDSLIKSKSYAGQIELKGSLSDEQIALWYQAADIFVLTPMSQQAGADIEGLGIVYLEAASFGCPIVASDSGGVGEFVKHDQNGLLVREGDSQAVAEALFSLVADSSLRSKLGQQGRRDVEKFTPEQQLAKLLNQ
jgi:phosphatidylinositol alpha-1,6-mannosyltransferase